MIFQKRSTVRWNLPQQMQNLPFDLKRSKLYPANPALVGRLIQNWDPNRTQPQLLPARFGYRQDLIYPQTRDVESVVRGVYAAVQTPVLAAQAIRESDLAARLGKGRAKEAQRRMYNPVNAIRPDPSKAPFIAQGVPTQTREQPPAAYTQTKHFINQVRIQHAVKPTLDKIRAIREALDTTQGIPLKVSP